MRIAIAIVKWLAVGLAAAVAWLWIAPPALFRVGSGYAAKIVCSNVFIAGREADVVLADDVQAPGNPLLRLMRVRVDRESGLVEAGLLGIIGGGRAVYREGLGCTVLPRGVLPKQLAAPQRMPAQEREWPASPDAAISALLGDDTLAGPGMRAALVIHDGRIIAERYGEGFGPNTPLLGWSMTKTVMAALVGAAVGEGRLNVGQSGLFPEWTDDSRAKVTIADLLGMESGLAFNEDYGHVSDVTRMLYLEPDMAAFVASLPAETEPGRRFRYSSGTTVLLSRVWQNAFPDDSAAIAWAYRTLFDPLGMRSAVLEADASGTAGGSSYLYATARDWARFAQMLLDDGIWRRRRILPEGWVEWMRAPAQSSRGSYGRHVWLHGPRRGPARGQANPDAPFDLPPDAFWMIGHDGQTIAIIPSRRLIVLRMGLTPGWLDYPPQALVGAVVKELDRRLPVDESVQ